MSKSTNRRPKRRNQKSAPVPMAKTTPTPSATPFLTPATKTAPKERGGSIRKILATVLGSSVTLLGIYAAYVPRVDVEGSGNPNEAGPTIFTIKNVGGVSLSYVQPNLGICEFVYGTHPIEPNHDPHSCCPGDPILSLLVVRPWMHPSLPTNGRFSITLQDRFPYLPSEGRPIGYADISIGVKFQPFLIPFEWPWYWPWYATYRFTTKVGPDGKLYWALN